MGVWICSCCYADFSGLGSAEGCLKLRLHGRSVTRVAEVTPVQLGEGTASDLTSQRIVLAEMGSRRVDGVQPLTYGMDTFSARFLERDSEGLVVGWVRALPAGLEALQESWDGGLYV